MARAKSGESIRGYKLLGDFRMAGGGNCEWTFAVKNGNDYFIKRFLNPKYPKPDGPGCEETKIIMRQECERFEIHQRELNEAVKKVAGENGRLVAAADFFREDNLFYKVAIKVPAATITPPEIARLPFAEKIRLLQNVCTAVTSLHNQKIVHGDLKVDNALLEKSAGDEPFIARLIDFDSSYFSQKPPVVDEMMGDPPYYSPELLDYVQKRDVVPSKLTTQSDIFALGIIFHQYLTGEMPEVGGDHKYLCEAVRAGYVVKPDSLDTVNPIGIRTLIASMLQLNFKDRPTAFTVQNQLREIRMKPDSVPTLPVPSTGETGEAESKTKPSDTKPREGLRGVKIPPTTVPSDKTEKLEEKPKPILIISSPTKKDPTSGERASPKSVETDRKHGDVRRDSIKSKVDLELSSTYKVVIEKLIESLSTVDSAVLAKVPPPKAPTRIKGTMAKEESGLSSDETETIEDITHRLADLQKYTDDVAKWLKGESSERPNLRITVSDLVVEVALTTEDGVIATYSVESAPVDATPVPAMPTEVVVESEPDTVAVLGEVATPVETEVVEIILPIVTPEIISDRYGEDDFTSKSLDTEHVTDIREVVDESGSNRRLERLKNRGGPTHS